MAENERRGTAIEKLLLVALISVAGLQVWATGGVLLLIVAVADFLL